jgi:hypothetical protein
LIKVEIVAAERICIKDEVNMQDKMVKNSRKHVNKLALKLLKVKNMVILMTKVTMEAVDLQMKVYIEVAELAKEDAEAVEFVDTEDVEMLKADTEAVEMPKAATEHVDSEKVVTEDVEMLKVA